MRVDFVREAGVFGVDVGESAVFCVVLAAVDLRAVVFWAGGGVVAGEEDFGDFLAAMVLRVWMGEKLRAWEDKSWDG